MIDWDVSLISHRDGSHGQALAFVNLVPVRGLDLHLDVIVSVPIFPKTVLVIKSR